MQRYQTLLAHLHLGAILDYVRMATILSAVSCRDAVTNTANIYFNKTTNRHSGFCNENDSLASVDFRSLHRLIISNFSNLAVIMVGAIQIL